MSEENINPEVDTTTNTETVSAESPKPAVDLNDADVKSLVESMVAEQLSSIKSKLDEAYSARDDAVKARVLLEEEKKSQEIKRMEEEGKHKEVAELRVAEMQAKMEALQKQNTELSRDNVVKSALGGLDFRSDIAGEMAYDRIVGQMIQDENGMWVHKSGVSIKEYVDHFSKDDTNAFLFKPKTNSGAGTQQAGTAPNTQSNKKISEMTSEEMLQHFAQQAPGITGNF